MRPEAMWSSSR